MGVQQVDRVTQPRVDGRGVGDEADAGFAENARRIIEQPFESGAHADMLAGTGIAVAEPMQSRPPRLHHLALRAADVDVTATFYRCMLALEIVRDERPRALWLGLADGSVVMVEARGAGEPAPSPGSLELFALEVTEDAKARIRRLAIEAGCFDGETAHTVYVRDPDGRRVGASTYPLDR